MKRVLLRHLEKINVFLQGLRDRSAKDKALNYEKIMKYPHVLDGYNQTIWGFIREGQLDKAQKMTLVANHKLSSGVISKYEKEDLTLFEDYVVIIESLVT